VEDREGVELGTVHGLTRGADGEIKTVQVALADPGHKGRSGVVALDAQSMVYLPQPRVIQIPASWSDIVQLPRIGQ
jgi:hypothetical protein